jgi:uncharacterized delta-60 repeat protein
VRLLSDGTLDTTYHVVAGFNGDVECLTIQPDGKLLAGGRFSLYNNSTAKFVARLNTDGSIDSTFNTITGAGSFVLSMALQPDGKVVIGGAFNTYKSTARAKVARLNSDASLDTTFNPGTGCNRTAWNTSLQTDGKILIGGIFDAFNGASVPRYTRLNSDGSLDTAFHPINVSIHSDTAIYAITVQPDGKLLVGGSFAAYCSCNYTELMRLYPDGSLDTSFRYRGNLLVGVYEITMLPDNKIMIGGGFTQYDSTAAYGMARILNDITLGVGDENEGSLIEADGIVYPNPFTNVLTLRDEGRGTRDVVLCDYTGKEILHAKSNSETTLLNTEGIAAGLYFVRVKGDRGVRNYKVVKE